MKTDNWHHAYREGWGKRLVPEAYAHPAKASYSLAQRIYEHAIAEGWLKPGDCVLDPFGGIGGFAYHALYHGLNFVGVELEPRFVMLGQQNIARWNARYSTLPGWGTATILQGDSRNLAVIVGEAAGCISSPPYAATELRLTDPERKQAIINQGRIDRGEISGGTGRSGALGASCNGSGYGTHPANLGNMRPGNLDAVISSPPYAETISAKSDGIDWAKCKADGKVRDFTREPGQAMRLHMDKEYGTTPGQLGAMPAGGFEAAVSSPPFSGSMVDSGDPAYAWKFHGDQSKYAAKDMKLHNDLPYMSPEWIEDRKRQAKLERNIANLPDEAKDPDYPTFWTAARTIVEQVYTVLRPGAHAIWVLKAYVRDRKIVDFPDQWRKMCEACGFETLHVHRAWLVEDHGAQATLDGKQTSRRKERKSFFRRLSENRAEARKYWEGLPRDERARTLWAAHQTLWREYREKLADPFEPLLEGTDVPSPPPVPVTPRRILDSAGMKAWEEAGKPRQEIETRIDWEIVLCQVKPPDAASQSGQASGCVSSPPFADVFHGQNDKATLEERSTRAGHALHPGGQLSHDRTYGTDPANLGNMRPGDFDGVLKPLNNNGKGDTQ